jgi:hypothetical protein
MHGQWQSRPLQSKRRRRGEGDGDAVRGFVAEPLYREGKLPELLLAKTQSYFEIRFLNDPTLVGAWEGSAARNEIRSERLIDRASGAEQEELQVRRHGSQ